MDQAVMNSQEQRLQQEIIADAQKKAERILAKAQADRERALKRMQKDLDARREERLAEVEREIAAHERHLRNGLSMERRRRWLAMREQSIQKLFAETLQQAEDSSGKLREESLCFLAEEALAQLGPGTYKVNFAPCDAHLVNEAWLQERSKQALGEEGGDCRFELVPDAELKAGIRFEAADQSRIFDNTLPGRLKLLQSELRNILASAGE